MNRSSSLTIKSNLKAGWRHTKAPFFADKLWPLHGASLPRLK
jgi:hypothetical protein